MNECMRHPVSTAPAISKEYDNESIIARAFSDTSSRVFPVTFRRRFGYANREKHRYRLRVPTAVAAAVAALAVASALTLP